MKVWNILYSMRAKNLDKDDKKYRKLRRAGMRISRRQDPLTILRYYISNQKLKDLKGRNIEAIELMDESKRFGKMTINL